MQQLRRHKSFVLLILIFLLSSCQKPRNEIVAQNPYNNQIFFTNHTFLKMNTKKNHQKALERLKKLENNPYSLDMQTIINLLSVPNIYSKFGDSETWFFKSCNLIITWKLEKNMYYIDSILNYKNEDVTSNIAKCAQKLY